MLLNKVIKFLTKFHLHLQFTMSTIETLINKFANLHFSLLITLKNSITIILDTSDILKLIKFKRNQLHL